MRTIIIVVTLLAFGCEAGPDLAALAEADRSPGPGDPIREVVLEPPEIALGGSSVLAIEPRRAYDGWEVVAVATVEEELYVLDGLTPDGRYETTVAPTAPGTWIYQVDVQLTQPRTGESIAWRGSSTLRVDGTDGGGTFGPLPDGGGPPACDPASCPSCAAPVVAPTLGESTTHGPIFDTPPPDCGLFGLPCCPVTDDSSGAPSLECWDSPALACVGGVCRGLDCGNADQPCCGSLAEPSCNAGLRCERARYACVAGP
jgi:hypothetical protein